MMQDLRDLMAERGCFPQVSIIPVSQRPSSVGPAAPTVAAAGAEGTPAGAEGTPAGAESTSTHQSDDFFENFYVLEAAARLPNPYPEASPTPPESSEVRKTVNLQNAGGNIVVHATNAFISQFCPATQPCLQSGLPSSSPDCLQMPNRMATARVCAGTGQTFPEFPEPGWQERVVQSPTPLLPEQRPLQHQHFQQHQAGCFSGQGLPAAACPQQLAGNGVSALYPQQHGGGRTVDVYSQQQQQQQQMQQIQQPTQWQQQCVRGLPQHHHQQRLQQQQVQWEHPPSQQEHVGRQQLPPAASWAAMRESASSSSSWGGGRGSRGSPQERQEQVYSMSVAHEQGVCKPCIFFYKGLCKKRRDCEYCHATHTGAQIRRVQPSRETRDCLRRRAAEVAARQARTEERRARRESHDGGE
mmetsp:Transcript_30063/g.75873  ORF Transcript_30063/g.75873 Transcript_30063/m.75873 type:complete len:413 (+) Transcript_30063:74-1312(+)